MDYLETHLDEELTLERLAEVACFSPYHFHRIFASICGEPVHQFVIRHRLERGARLLATEPDRTVTDIALECGFAGHSSFTKSFRAKFGMPPSAYRSRMSKNGQGERKTATAPPAPSGYIEHRKRLQIWHGEEGNQVVRLVDEPALDVAYIRHIGPYAGDARLFDRLWREFGSWAGPRGLMDAKDVRYLAIYHNDPDVTAEPLLRVSVGCTVPPGTVGAGSVEVLRIEPGLYARSEHVLGPADYGAAWNWVYGAWLPESGYVPADGYAYEEFFTTEDPSLPPGKHRVDICLPVQIPK
jgi:AraC family transcriptional regulator